MWYFIHAVDNPDSLERRWAARPAHAARLQALQDEGRILTAGPLPTIDAEDPGPAGFSGSLLVVEFDSLDDAREWAESDPYFEAGAYAAVEVFPYKAIYPR